MRGTFSAILAFRMRMRLARSARIASGAFLLLLARVGTAEIRIAAERADHTCPAGTLLGVVPLDRAEPPAEASRCLVVLPLTDLSDASLDAAAVRAARLPPVAAAAVSVLSPARPADPEWNTRLAYATRKVTSAIRGASPDARVAWDLTVDLAPTAALALTDPDIAPYVDAFVQRPGRGAVSAPDVAASWMFVPRVGATAPGDVVRAVTASAAAPEIVALESAGDRPIGEADWPALARLQKYWTADVSRDPTSTTARRRAGGGAFPVARFYDAKAFTPILLLPEDATGAVSIDLAGGPFARASVENLSSGARRDFDVKGAPTLTLDLSQGPLAVVLQPASRPGGERTAVEVGATRGLTAEEIVARERAWDAGQREKTRSFVADMKASLRFRIAEVNETFDLTILGPFFFRRDEPADWAWQEFYLNGVKWKGRTLPKLPILQPEKVTTLPLDIRLTEDYAYTLHGDATVSGRRAYHIVYVPKSTTGDRPVYRGAVWIDKETFALLRRDSVQMNLKGETLSNVQTEIYRAVPGQPDAWLPLEIRGQQVFSTAGRTTAIERDVVLQNVQVNLPDFETRRAAVYASPTQMIRDTDRGMRYLVPDPAHPGQRIVEEKLSKKSTFGLLGAFYDNALSYPIPLLGLQHFNFDLWGKGKQLSIFFGGVLLTANYTDPSIAGSRFDLGADLFAVGVAFGDTSYRNGREITGEKIKHLPAVFQVNVGHPFGPYLKGSVSVFSKWDDFQRDKDTAPDFVTPTDTLTEGGEVKLVGNIRGFAATLSGSYFHRNRWDPWGIAGSSEYNPDQQNYWKYSASIAKDQYFPGFRKLHVSVAYYGGSRLDRFSKYEFGTFSGNPIRGYSSGSLRVEKAWLANVSYGLNIENIIRFEGFYDQALATERVAGYHNTYFSGAGVLASLNGPWSNSLMRAEVGVPVVSHGIHGFVVNVLLLKLF